MILCTQEKDYTSGLSSEPGKKGYFSLAFARLLSCVDVTLLRPTYQSINPFPKPSFISPLQERQGHGPHPIPPPFSFCHVPLYCLSWASNYPLASFHPASYISTSCMEITNNTCIHVISIASLCMNDTHPMYMYIHTLHERRFLLLASVSTFMFCALSVCAWAYSYGWMCRTVCICCHHPLLYIYICIYIYSIPCAEFNPEESSISTDRHTLEKEGDNYNNKKKKKKVEGKRFEFKLNRQG